MKKTLLVTIGLLMLVLSACGGNAEATPPKSDSAPEVSAAQVSFANDVMPILGKSCGGCHSNSQASGGFDISSYDSIAEHDEAIVPGNASGSLLIQLVSSGKMPKRGDKLTPAQIQTITDWINAGAPNN